MNKKEITPLLLGLDLGAYSMAVAFHEATGAVSHAMGRAALGASSYSKIVIPHIIPDILTEERAISEIKEFANGRGPVLAVPCEDWYVRLVGKIRHSLPENVRVVVPDDAILGMATDKSKFYDLLDGFGIDYPRTAVFCSECDISSVVTRSFSFPAVIKPSDSSEYWRHPFFDMKKVYFPTDAVEAEKTAEKIFSSGYGGSVIMQEKIGNAHERVGVYTAVLDNTSRAICGAFGRVMLGEPTPTGTGNHVGIITEPAPEICNKLDKMLEKIGYVGIANFDLISDGERWYVLEINPRQGRSSDYTRACGVNLAEALISIAFGEEYIPSRVKDILWRCVPRRVLFRFCPHPELLSRAERLSSVGEEYDPYSYAADLRKNPLRRAYIALHAYRHMRRFMRYAGK